VFETRTAVPRRFDVDKTFFKASRAWNATSHFFDVNVRGIAHTAVFSRNFLRVAVEVKSRSFPVLKDKIFRSGNSVFSYVGSNFNVQNTSISFRSIFVFDKFSVVSKNCQLQSQPCHCLTAASQWNVQLTYYDKYTWKTVINKRDASLMSSVNMLWAAHRHARLSSSQHISVHRTSCRNKLL
jgi:hypothetical protein